MRRASKSPAGIALGLLGVALTLSAVFSPGGDVFARTTRQKTSAARVGRAEALEAQRRLAELGYWVGGVDGWWGGNTRHGLIAFQKVEGRPRTGELTEDELQALRSAGRPRPLESGYPHVEVDLSRQVLFVVGEGGAVVLVLPVSTGNDRPYTQGGRTRRAHTPRGRFKVYRKIEGWRRSPLGLLYYPNYITGGVAIHGSLSVPTYPASHGCIRIPLFAARDFSRMAPVGTGVIVYDDRQVSGGGPAGRWLRGGVRAPHPAGRGETGG